MSELHTLSADIFAPHLGSGFVLEAEDGTAIAVTLAQCLENPRGTLRGTPRTAFSLYLECPSNDVSPFSGGHFVLAHPVIGRIGPVYVGRIHPGNASQDVAVFQVIFN